MPRGGKRLHAGRPLRTGKYKEATQMMRIPMSRVNEVRSLLTPNGPMTLPLFSSKVRAGFPSPADDFLENSISLDEHLIQRPASTFCLRVAGDSMVEVGIFPGDMLIVDRSITAQSGDVVVAMIDGEFTVKRLMKKRNKIYLVPENKNYQPIEMKQESDLTIWGVVIHSVRYFTQK